MPSRFPCRRPSLFVGALIGLLGLFGASAPASRAGEAPSPASSSLSSETGTTEAALPPGEGPIPSPGPAAGPWTAEFELLKDAVRLRWRPLPGAVRYFVEAAADPVLLRRLWMGATDAPEVLIPLQGFEANGPIYVRLQAVDSQAKEIASLVTSSLLGRQNDLPSGIAGITVTTQPASPPPTLPPEPRRSFRWRSPLFTRDYTLASGRYGDERYNNYLVSHGLDFNGDSPSAVVSTGARLLFSANDREGLAFNRSDMNLNAYLAVGFKRIPLNVSYSGYLYRYLGSDALRSVNTFSAGYRATPRLMTGFQFTPDPRYLSVWGTYALPHGDALSVYLTNGDFTNAVTLSYHSQQVLR